MIGCDAQPKNKKKNKMLKGIKRIDLIMPKKYSSNISFYLGLYTEFLIHLDVTALGLINGIPTALLSTICDIIPNVLDRLNRTV